MELHDHTERVACFRDCSVLRSFKNLANETFDSSWDRGLNQPEFVDPGSTELPVLRLTVDDRGLKRVERLATPPVFAPQNREDRFAFVVSKVEDLKNVKIQFKVWAIELHYHRELADACCAISLVLLYCILVEIYRLDCGFGTPRRHLMSENALSHLVKFRQICVSSPSMYMRSRE